MTEHVSEAHKDRNRVKYCNYKGKCDGVCIGLTAKCEMIKCEHYIEEWFTFMEISFETKYLEVRKQAMVV